MLSWKKRPFEIANLLNPAFCSVLLYESISEYSKKKGQGMPFALSYLILPIILHKQTRHALPKNAIALLHPWFQNNGEVRIGFAQRVSQLVPYTKEAIIFGMQAEILTINDGGEFIPGQRRLASTNWESISEAAECRAKAKILGSWYSKTQDISSIFIMWGVRP
jgi:hypothetical protein